jgi:glycogen operon protein
MNDEQWTQSNTRSLGLYLSGSAIMTHDKYGNLIEDNDFLLLLNAHHEETEFSIPEVTTEQECQVVTDTVSAAFPITTEKYHAGDSYLMHGRSLVLLMHGRKTQ